MDINLTGIIINTIFHDPFLQLFYKLLALSTIIYLASFLLQFFNAGKVTSIVTRIILSTALSIYAIVLSVNEIVSSFNALEVHYQYLMIFFLALLSFLTLFTLLIRSDLEKSKP